MFSFLKKKKAQYCCLGVKHREEGISPDDLESCFEVFEKYFSKRIYTQEEIDEIIKKFGFNIHDYYVFVDQQITNSANKKTSMKIYHRWFGSNKISGEEIEKMIDENLSSELNYTRVDIEKISEKVGFSIYDRNDFRSYLIAEYSFESNDEVYYCIINNKEEL